MFLSECRINVSNTSKNNTTDNVMDPEVADDLFDVLVDDLTNVNSDVSGHAN